jgi:hypothetical protein
MALVEPRLKVDRDEVFLELTRPVQRQRRRYEDCGHGRKACECRDEEPGDQCLV